MITKLIRVTILVRDQDEALKFYTEKLGLEKKADMTFGPGMRWLTVAPKDQKDLEIVLLKPEPAMNGDEVAKVLASRVGQGTPWVLATDNCQKTYEDLVSRGVKFTTPPKQQMYGVEAVFEDLYGNPFSLLQPSAPA